MSDFRDDFREVETEARWTLGRLVPYLFILLIVGIAVGWFIKMTYIVDKDIDREVTTHSRQYVESTQARLENLMSQYTGLEVKIAEVSASEEPDTLAALKAQQTALLNQMRGLADKIPSSEVPTSVQRALGR